MRWVYGDDVGVALFIRILGASYRRLDRAGAGLEGATDGSLVKIIQAVFNSARRSPRELPESLHFLPDGFGLFLRRCISF
jgi:hypothetical protein